MRRRQEGKRRPRWDDVIHMMKHAMNAFLYVTMMEMNSRGSNTTPMM